MLAFIFYQRRRKEQTHQRAAQQHQQRWAEGIAVHLLQHDV